MGIVVGGDTAWKQRRHGEIVVAYHWVNDEPAMVLFPAFPGANAGAFILALSSAWKYADSVTGEPTPYLLQQTVPIARQLGMFVTSDTLRKIADVIVDGLLDLVEMPPEPPELERTRRLKEGRAGELAILADGETVMEAEV